jgi:serine/threonine protein kinase
LEYASQGVPDQRESGEFDVDIDDPSGPIDRRDPSPLPDRFALLDQDIRLEKFFRKTMPHECQPVMIGRFEALDRIGEGGFGVVYLARDPDLGRLVAVKLCPNLRPEVIDVFQREAQLLALFSHPNVVTVFEVGWRGEDFFYAMEYIDGCDGAHFIPQWIELKHVLEVYEAAASGLAAAHDKGIVHGDFKPANVLIGKDGRVCVADFGLAQLIDDGTGEGHPTAASHRFGTLAYMAPELLTGGQADARADQWSLCVSLWETIFLRRPFEGDTPEVLLAAIESGPPRIWWSLQPRAVQHVLRKGLSVNPADRYPNMRALARALAEIHEPSSRPPSSGRRPRVWEFVRAMMLAGAVVLAAFALERFRAVRRPVEVEVPATMPREPVTPCALDGSSKNPDPVVVAVCTTIRDGQFNDADALWERERSARQYRNHQRAQATPALEDREILASELAYVLGLDTMLVAHTFMDQAEAMAHENPTSAALAAESARTWALRATKDGLDPQDEEVQALIARAMRLAPQTD